MRHSIRLNTLAEFGARSVAFLAEVRNIPRFTRSKSWNRCHCTGGESSSREGGHESEPSLDHKLVSRDMFMENGLCSRTLKDMRVTHPLCETTLPTVCFTLRRRVRIHSSLQMSRDFGIDSLDSRLTCNESENATFPRRRKFGEEFSKKSLAFISQSSDESDHKQALTLPSGHARCCCSRYPPQWRTDRTLSQLFLKRYLESRSLQVSKISLCADFSTRMINGHVASRRSIV